MKYKNNPLNIRHSSKFVWKGEVSHFNGFCVFSNQWFGYRAALIILSKYKKRGLVTLKDIVSTWAPSSENPTDNYVSFVCHMLTLSPDVPIFNDGMSKSQILFSLLYWMSVFEQGTNYHVNSDVLRDCVHKYIYLFN